MLQFFVSRKNDKYLPLSMNKVLKSNGYLNTREFLIESCSMSMLIRMNAVD